jgi:hypothetical protein
LDHADHEAVQGVRELIAEKVLAAAVITGTALKHGRRSLVLREVSFRDVIRFE